MDRIGARELWRRASAILRRVAGGGTFEINHRGRPTAMTLKSMPHGLARLEREGLLRRGEGNLVDVRPVLLPAGARRPSDLVSEGRDE